MSEQKAKLTFELKDGSIISSNRPDEDWSYWIDNRWGEYIITDDNKDKVNIKMCETKRVIIDHPEFKIVKYFKRDKKDSEPKEEQTTLELINKIDSMANKYNLSIEDIESALNILKLIKEKEKE